MRIVAVAVVGMCFTAPVTFPAAAQSVGDVGRQLLQQVLPGQQQPQPDVRRERNAYEQGRLDAERERRYRAEQRRREMDARRGGYERRRGPDDVERYRRDRDAYENSGDDRDGRGRRRY